MEREEILQAEEKGDWEVRGWTVNVHKLPTKWDLYMNHILYLRNIIEI